jgi:NAD(P)-dependent dehydrogenase (short-subunit alcohol dehydrogenase family)
MTSLTPATPPTPGSSGAGRTVIVTGAASGIGAACTTVLRREGWRVIATDLVTDGLVDAAADPAAERAAELAADGRIVPLDVTEEADWARVFEQAGPVYGLVACAGIRTRSMIVDTDLATWERHLRVNVTGPWLGARAFLRGAAGAMAGGSIVTITSVNATIAVPGQAHYVASKGAVASLTRAIALEGAPQGIRANAIAPGPIRTPMAAERLDDPEQVRWLTGRVPLGRVGEPPEIAEVVEFLLSDRASYVSGEVLYVDGGWAANAV